MTPVPIPNTEVKHFRGENTLYGEDSSLPALNKSLIIIFNLKEFLDNYRTLFSDHTFLMIGAKCNLETLEERENIRGDRVIGMAKIFYQSEKNFQYPYDLVVDATHELPSINAKNILELLKN